MVGAPLFVFVATEVMTLMPTDSLAELGREVELDGLLELDEGVSDELESDDPPLIGFCFLLLSREKRMLVVLQQGWPPLSSGRLVSQHQEFELHSRRASLPAAVLSISHSGSTDLCDGRVARTLCTYLRTTVRLPALVGTCISPIVILVR